jgi:hypothetical protein
MRREIRVGLVAALAAVLVAVVLIWYALVSGPRPAAPPAALPSSVSPVREPSASEQPSPPEATSTMPEPPPPGGGISRQGLRRSTLDLPAWPPGALDGCPSGKFHFSGAERTELKRQYDSIYLTVEKVAYVDVDHDGRYETVAEITCAVQGGTAQVVVVKRGSAGAIVTLGQVVGSGYGPIHDVNDIRADPGGAVGVQVADIGSMDGSDVFQHVQRQWRGYSWNGRTFAQTTGPTSFPPNPYITDLAVTATDLHLASASGGTRHGGVTVTVRNSGASTPTKVTLWLATSGSLTFQPPAGLTCESRPDGAPGIQDYFCTAPALGPGSSVAYTFSCTGSDQLVGPQPAGRVTVGGLVSGFGGMLDHTQDNNSANFHVIVD